MLCVVCSAGGHLSEALSALASTKAPRYFVTYGEDHAKKWLSGEEAYYVEDPHVSIIKYLKNAYQSIIILLRKRPKVILSTGSGIALATCIFGKMIGAKVIYLESGARITSPSRTGKLMYYIADDFIVQWEPLLRCFPKATYVGSLI